MVLVQKDGETFKGWIEWYDRDSIKFNREGEPNLFIPKSSIKYMYKDEEAAAARSDEPEEEGGMEEEESSGTSKGRGSRTKKS